MAAIAIQNARYTLEFFLLRKVCEKSERLTTLELPQIAHEIRNPLMVVRLFFDSLELSEEADITVKRFIYHSGEA